MRPGPGVAAMLIWFGAVALAVLGEFVMFWWVALR